MLKGARGRSVRATVEALTPVLRGRAAYFKLTETKRALEYLDAWLGNFVPNWIYAQGVAAANGGRRHPS